MNTENVSKYNEKKAPVTSAILNFFEKSRAQSSSLSTIVNGVTKAAGGTTTNSVRTLLHKLKSEGYVSLDKTTGRWSSNNSSNGF